MHCCNGFPGEICIAVGNYHSMSGSAPTLQPSQQRTLLKIQFWMAAAPYGELQLVHGGTNETCPAQQDDKNVISCGLGLEISWLGGKQQDLPEVGGITK